jgi:hypothetical protein
MMSQQFQGFNQPNTTPTPNQFYDELLSSVKTLAELKVILYVIRHTYGWGKLVDRISLSQFVDGIQGVDGGTGLSLSSVQRGLATAIDNGYIVRYVVCQSCGSPIDDRATVERLSVGTEELAMIDVDVAPATCPFCLSPLRGKEQLWYSLAFRHEDRFAMLKGMGGSYKTFIKRVQTFFSEDDKDNDNGSECVQDPPDAGDGEVRGQVNEQPKSIVASTGDKQRDYINLKGKANSMLSTEYVARKWLSVMLPESQWPEDKADKNARAQMLEIVRQVEAVVGRGSGKWDPIISALEWIGSYVNDPMSQPPDSLDVKWLRDKRTFPAWKSAVQQHAVQRPWERRASTKWSQQVDNTETIAIKVGPTPKEMEWESIREELSSYAEPLTGAVGRPKGKTYVVTVPGKKFGWIDTRLRPAIERVVRLRGYEQVEIVAKD